MSGTHMALGSMLIRIHRTAWVGLGAALSTMHGAGALSAERSLSPTASASDVCSAPTVNAKLDRATFLWKDCDGTERWHLRVTGGGTTTTLNVTGVILSTGGVTNLVPVSIEASDVLDTQTNPSQLRYALKLSGSGTDGFDFGVAANACFTPGGPSGLPIYLGAGRVPMPTGSLDLSTIQACIQPSLDSDGDGLTDAEEAILGTDPSVWDTDGGGMSDGAEVAANKNPLDPNDDYPVGTWSISFTDVTTSAGVQGNAVESWGAAWGDLDGDGYPDLFTSNHRVPGRLLRNNGNGTFSDVTVAADPGKAILNSGDSHGAVWADIDNDGDQDLTIAVAPLESYLLINTNGVLRDQRAARGFTIGFQSESRMPVYFDLNNDGLLDAKLINWEEHANQDTMFVQNADHTFARPVGSDGVHCLTSDWAQLMDINGTGPLELLCGDRTGFPSAVYDLATGVGVLLPVTKVAQGIDAISGDFDGDLRPDLVILRGLIRPTSVARASANRLEVQLLIGLTGQYTLTIPTAGSLVTELTPTNWNVLQSPGGMNYVYIGATGYHPASGKLALAPGDPQNSGIQAPGGRNGIFIGYDPANVRWQVIFAARNLSSNGYFVIDSDQPIGTYTLSGTAAGNAAMTPVLLRGSPSGLVDATAGSGLTPVHCVSGVAGDFDNDMDLDLFLVCRDGAQNLVNIAFENLGNGTFRRVALTGAEGRVGPALSAAAGTSESVAMADYDEDGFLDLFVTNGLNLRPKGYGGDNQLFRNSGNSNSWLEFDLVGRSSNRDGLGAKILVSAGGVTQYREQNGGYHRWSQNHTRIHVGLGVNNHADVTVNWPSGIVDTFTNVAANAIYVITEGQGIAARQATFKAARVGGLRTIPSGTPVLDSPD
jgi:ASPIC and UnbV/FG-GAP-like repeat/Bacterial TSP3 repeat